MRCRTQFIVDIVSDANKLLVLVQTEQEHDSDIQQILVRNERWIWCFGLRALTNERQEGREGEDCAIKSMDTNRTFSDMQCFREQVRIREKYKKQDGCT